MEVEMGRIFVIEDDNDQCDLLAYSLRKSGHQVQASQSGEDALRNVASFNPDAIIMDVMLPDTTGFELCKCMKFLTSAPVILFSAVRITEEDRIRGLTGGAQDYLTKSHSHRELLARVQNLLQSRQAAHTVISILFRGAVLQILLLEQRVLWNNKEVFLTATEFKMLVVLAKAPGVLVSYKDISQAVWGIPASDSTMVKSCFSRMRSKFNQDDASSKLFGTVSRQGYILMPLHRPCL
jgi:DNA-binding response OmpR family regulator